MAKDPVTGSEETYTLTFRSNLRSSGVSVWTERDPEPATIDLGGEA
jgi:hypothetical protein